MGAPSLRELLECHGYATVRGAVPDAAVRRALAAVTRSGSSARTALGSAAPELLKARPILDLLNAPGVVRLIDELLGLPRIDPVARAQIAVVHRHCGVEEPIAADKLAWHIDGMNKKSLGHFSLLIGVVLTDLTRSGSGSLAVWPGSHRTIEQWFAAELACERERASSSSGSPDVVSAVLQRVVERFCSEPPQLYPEDAVELLCSPGDVVILPYHTAHTATRIANALCPAERVVVYFRVRLRDASPMSLETLADPFRVFRDIEATAQIGGVDDATVLKGALYRCVRHPNRSRAFTISCALLFRFLQRRAAAGLSRLIMLRGGAERLCPGVHTFVGRDGDVVDVVLPALRVVARRARVALLELDLFAEACGGVASSRPDPRGVRGALVAMSQCCAPLLIAASSESAVVLALGCFAELHESTVIVVVRSTTSRSDDDDERCCAIPPLDVLSSAAFACWCDSFFTVSDAVCTRSSLPPHDDEARSSSLAGIERCARERSEVCTLATYDRVFGGSALHGLGSYCRYVVEGAPAEDCVFYAPAALPRAVREALHAPLRRLRLDLRQARGQLSSEFVSAPCGKHQAVVFYVEVKWLVKPMAREVHALATSEFVTYGTVPASATKRVLKRSGAHERLLVSGSWIDATGCLPRRRFKCGFPSWLKESSGDAVVDELRAAASLLDDDGPGS